MRQVCGILALALLSHAAASTNINLGIIQGNYTLTKTGSPYLVQGSSAEMSAEVLVIEPSVTLVFPAGFNLAVKGKLLAQGTMDEPIRFITKNTASICGGGPLSDVTGSLSFSGEGSLLRHVTICFAKTIVGRGNFIPVLNHVSVSYGSVKLLQSKQLVRVDGLTVTKSPSTGLAITSGIGSVELNEVVISESQGHGFGYAYENTVIHSGVASDFCLLQNTTVDEYLYFQWTAIESNCTKIFEAKPGEILVMVIDYKSASFLEVCDGDSSSSPLLWSRQNYLVGSQMLQSSSEKLWMNLISSRDRKWSPIYFLIYSKPKTEGNIVIRNSRFFDNLGHGITMELFSHLDMSDSSIFANQQHGVFIRPISNRAAITLSNSSFSVTNVPTKKESYGVYVDGIQGDLSVINSEFMVVNASSAQQGVNGLVVRSRSWSHEVIKNLRLKGVWFTNFTTGIDFTGLCGSNVTLDTVSMNNIYSHGLMSSCSIYRDIPVAYDIKNSTFDKIWFSRAISIDSRELLFFQASENFFIKNNKSMYIFNGNNSFLVVTNNVFRGMDRPLHGNLILYVSKSSDSHLGPITISGNKFENMKQEKVIRLEISCAASSDIVENSFVNVTATHLLDVPTSCWSDLLTKKARVNATYNWWGTADKGKILKSVSGHHTGVLQKEIDLYPFYTSPEMTDVYDGVADYRMISPDGKFVGGQIKNTHVIKMVGSPHKIMYDINVLESGKLVIEPGAKLQFYPGTRMLIVGELEARGTQENKIEAALYMDQLTSFRLVADETKSTSKSVLEVKVKDTWGPVCQVDDIIGRPTDDEFCRMLGYSRTKYSYSRDIKANENYTAVSVGVRCNDSKGVKSLDSCQVLPCMNASFCYTCRIVTLSCIPKVWLGIHLTDTAKPSTLQHVHLSGTGGDSGALVIDRHRHIISNIAIDGESTGITVRRVDFKMRPPLSNIDIVLKQSQLCLSCSDTHLKLHNVHCISKGAGFPSVRMQTSIVGIWQSYSDFVKVMCTGDSIDVDGEVLATIQGTNSGGGASMKSFLCNFNVNAKPGQKVNMQILYVKQGSFRGQTCVASINDTIDGGETSTTSCLPPEHIANWISKGNRVSFSFAFNPMDDAVVLRFSSVANSFDSSLAFHFEVNKLTCSSLTINSPLSSVSLQDSVMGGGWNGVSVNAHSLVIRDTTIAGYSSYGLQTRNVTEVLLTGTKFANSSKAVFIYNEHFGLDLQIDNCSFENTSSGLVSYDNRLSKLLVKNSLFFMNGDAVVLPKGAENIYVMDSVFNYVANMKFGPMCNNVTLLGNVFSNVPEVPYYSNYRQVFFEALSIRMDGNTFRNLSLGEYTNDPLHVRVLESAIFENNVFVSNKIALTSAILNMTAWTNNSSVHLINNSFVGNYPVNPLKSGVGYCANVVGPAAVVVEGDVLLYVKENVFENPKLPLELIIMKPPDNPSQTIDISRNYWGSSDEDVIFDRIKDGRQITFYSISNVYPFYNSSSKQHLMAQDTDSLKVFDGGSVKGSVVLKLENSPYHIRRHVIVETGSILVVQPGVVMTFRTGVGIMVFGQLKAAGDHWRYIELKVDTNQCPKSDGWAGIQLMGQEGSPSVLEYVHMSNVAVSHFHKQTKPAAAIQVYDAAPVMNHVTITNSYSGIIVYKTPHDFSLSDITVSQLSGPSPAITISEVVSDISLTNMTLLCRFGVSYNTLDDVIRNADIPHVGSFSFCRGMTSPVFVSPTKKALFNKYLGQSRRCKRTFFTTNNYVLQLIQSGHSTKCIQSPDFQQSSRRGYNYGGQFEVSTDSSSMTLTLLCDEDQLSYVSVEAVPYLYAPCIFSKDFCGWEENIHLVGNFSSMNYTKWHVKAESYACAGHCPDDFNSPTLPQRKRRQSAENFPTPTPQYPAGVSHGDFIAAIERSVRPEDNVCRLQFEITTGNRYYRPSQSPAKISVLINQTMGTYQELHSQIYNEWGWTPFVYDIPGQLRNVTYSIILLAIVKPGRGIGLDNLKLLQCPDDNEATLQKIVIKNSYFFNSTKSIHIQSSSNSESPSSDGSNTNKIIEIKNNIFEYVNCSYGCHGIDLNVKVKQVSVINNRITGYSGYAVLISPQNIESRTSRVFIIQNQISDALQGVAVAVQNYKHAKVDVDILHNYIERNKFSNNKLIFLHSVSSTFSHNLIQGNGNPNSYGNHIIISGGRHVFTRNVLAFNAVRRYRNRYSMLYLQYLHINIHHNVIVDPQIQIEIKVNSLTERGLNINATDNWWGSKESRQVWYRVPISSNRPNFVVEPYLLRPPNLMSFISTKCSIGWLEMESSCLTVILGGNTHQKAKDRCEAKGGVLISLSRMREIASNLRDLTKYQDYTGADIFTPLWTAEKQNGKCTLLQLTADGFNTSETSCLSRAAASCEGVQVTRCPNSCFGFRGKCEGTTCVCHRGWTGEDCSMYECSAVANCSGHGKCIGPNTCECNSGWKGNSCSYSACSRHYSCQSCAREDGCGWCDDLGRWGQCFPGTPRSIDSSLSCRAWFYHRCTTAEGSKCSRYIKAYPCISRLCKGKQKDNEKCQSCRDFDNCHKILANSSCKLWDEDKCPGGIVNVDYTDPTRILKTKINDNVRIFAPNETLLYNCPVLFGNKEKDDSILIIAPMDVKVQKGEVLSSAQSGGIMHKVEAKKTIEPYTFIHGSPATLEEVIGYADFRNTMNLIPLEDEQLLEDIPENSLLDNIMTNNITLPELHVLRSELPVYKCLGHGYELEDGGNVDYSFYLVVAANENTRKFDRGMVLAGNSSDGFLETVVKVESTKFGLVVETEMTQCTEDLTWDHKLTMLNKQDFSCSGGRGKQGLHFYEKANKAVDVGSTIIGRKSKGFVAQVANVTENNGYLFIEVIAVTDIDDGNITTALDLTSIHSGRRVKRSSGGIVERIKNFFSKNFKPKFSGKVTAKTTVKVTFEPKVKLKLKISASKPYVHEVGVSFSGKLEGFVEQRIDFQGSFSVSGPNERRYNNPIANKQVGTFALPIWPTPLLTLPGKFLFDVKFKITAKADVKGFLSGSITATGTMDAGATWRPNSNLDIEGPTFGFGVQKVFDGELDKEKTKASMTAVLTPSLKAQWPSVPTIPSYIKWALPSSLEEFLGLGKARQSISILQATVSAPFFLTLWADACSDRCKDPKKPLSVGVRGGLKSVNGVLNVKAFGYQKNFNFLRYSNPKLIATGSTCLSQPVPCCICEDGEPGVLDPETDECMCECFCDPPDNTIKSVKPKDGECECELCPDGTPKVKKPSGELWCPCDCPDGSVSEQKADGTCDCECTCPDGSTDSLDANGDCPCRCKCKNCEDSTKGPDGCICPNDICPKCDHGVPKWSNCECKCVEEYECGVPPACAPGRKGPGCNQPDCSNCNNCNGHGYCRSRGGTSCSSYCQCHSGYRGRCCRSKDPRSGSGDPHFITLDGCRHDFMGIGEYWDCLSEELDFGVQVRFWGRARGYGGVSLTGGIAVKIGNSTFTVMTYENEVRARVDDELIVERGARRLDGNTATLQVARNSYVLDFENGVYITVRFYRWGGHPSLSYSMVLPDHLQSKTSGLCGNFDGTCANDMTGPDGQKYQNPYDFGVSWQIHSSSRVNSTWSWTDSNFHPNDSMDIYFVNPEYVPRKPSRFGRRRREETPLELKATQICGEKKLTGVLFDNCVDDIVLMNDTSFGDQEEFKIVECPSGCNDHGNCVNGSCVCIDGWTGEECEIGLCGSINCSVNSDCVKGFCKCKTGWEGPTCDREATCYNVNNCTDEDHGVCKVTDVCLCTVGFTGADCSVVATCYNRDNCSDNGVCIDIDVCRCNTGWSGDSCTEYTCETLGFCSGHGQCIGFDVCSCTSGWTGLSCSTPDCPDDDQCSGQGSCTAPNTCECDQGYTGESCNQLLSCPDVDDCSGHGMCFNVSGTLTCTCDVGFSGPTCAAVDCPADNCTGNGVCKEPNVCTCNMGYTGSSCNKYSCETLKFCSGHGSCTAYDVCSCEDGWSGVACDVANCSKVSDCNGQGQCIAPNTCDCYPNFDGESCNQALGVNQNDPVFEQIGIVKLGDNVDAGKVVVTVNATDADSGKNGRVGYTLTSNTETFVIGNTGTISTSKAIDFDHVPGRVFVIIVRAYDQGFPKRSATATVTVLGTDVNDNCPVFQTSPTIQPVEIPESTAVNTLVGSLVATDADSGLNSKIVYELTTDTDSVSTYFNISSTGDIRTTVEPLVSGRYVLTVVAKDSANNPCKTTKELTILVVRQEVVTTTQAPDTTTTMSSTTDVADSSSVTESPTSAGTSTQSSITMTTDITKTTEVTEDQNNVTTQQSPVKTTTPSQEGLSETVKILLGVFIPLVILLLVGVIVVGVCTCRQKKTKNRNITMHNNPIYDRSDNGR